MRGRAESADSIHETRNERSSAVDNRSTNCSARGMLTPSAPDAKLMRPSDSGGGGTLFEGGAGTLFGAIDGREPAGGNVGKKARRAMAVTIPE